MVTLKYLGEISRLANAIVAHAEPDKLLLTNTEVTLRKIKEMALEIDINVRKLYKEMQP